MKHTTSLLAGGLLLSAAWGAHAQAPQPQLRLDSGFYVGAAGGKARTGERCIGTCDVTDASWSLFAGYLFNRHFAIEGGYSDFGTVTTGATLVGVPVSNQLETTVVELTGVGLLPITERFSLYGKAGVYRYDTDARTTGAFVGTSSDKGYGFTAGAGLQYAFSNNFAARLEWQSYSDVGTGVPGLEKDDVTVWRLGARYKF